TVGGWNRHGASYFDGLMSKFELYAKNASGMKPKNIRNLRSSNMVGASLVSDRMEARRNRDLEMAATESLGRQLASIRPKEAVQPAYSALPSQSCPSTPRVTKFTRAANSKSGGSDRYSLRRGPAMAISALCARTSVRACR